MCWVRYFKDSNNNNFFLYLSQQTNTCSKSTTETLKIQTEDYPNKNEILLMVLFWELCKIFKNTFFTEHLRVTAADIRMQVVVIYNLNLSLQFVAINFEFSRWPCFNVAWISTSICFSVWLFLTMSLQDSF